MIGWALPLPSLLISDTNSASQAFSPIILSLDTCQDWILSITPYAPKLLCFHFFHLSRVSLSTPL